jgi:hypothetical protein
VGDDSDRLAGLLTGGCNRLIGGQIAHEADEDGNRHRDEDQYNDMEFLHNGKYGFDGAKLGQKPSTRPYNLFMSTSIPSILFEYHDPIVAAESKVLLMATFTGRPSPLPAGYSIPSERPGPVPGY